MKKFFSVIISLFLYTTVALADDKIALIFNIIPDDDSRKNSIIDSKIQTKLNFKVFFNQGKIYFNGTEVNINNNSFNIDITNLIGKQEIKFTNSDGEEAIFTYYISDETGLVKNFCLEDSPTYITTVDNVKILYTQKDAKKIDLIKSLIKNAPEKIKINLKEIILLPTNNESKAAGITNYNKITLYNISNYTNSQIKRILLHEIAHTWAHVLRQNKIIDYSYTDLQKAIKADKNFVTKYSKNSASEDFADSISLYLINKISFEKKFPSRASYIESIL